jgi:lysophospholipase L1-like esterase
MKRTIALLVVALPLVAQVTQNNLTVRTNLSVGQSLILTPSAMRRASSDVSQLFTIGDSFTFGASATARSNNYVSKLGVAMNMTPTNIANGSFSIADANWTAFPGWVVTNTYSPSTVFQSPAAITEDMNFTAMIGFNDTRTASGIGTAPSAARYRLGLDHLIRYLAIPDSAKRFAVSPDASTGTWTTNSWTAFAGKAAESSSGTLTFSNIIGSEVYIGYLAWATNYGGTISVSVDGGTAVAVSTASAAYGNREYIQGGDAMIPPQTGPYGTGEIDFCPHSIRVPTSGSGAHTIVVTVSSAPTTVIWVAGNGTRRTSRKGPNVFIGTIPRQSPWTSAGTDVKQSQYNEQVEQAVALARYAGLRVTLAPTADYYSPATEQDVDGVHPNNAGHTSIANAFISSMSGDVGLPPVATTRPIIDTIATTGAVNVGGIFTVTPPATSAGYLHRFGADGVSATAVQINSGNNTADRRLILTGNSISSVLNTTGATAQNLALGASGVNVVVNGGMSVGGGTAFSRIRHGRATLAAGSPSSSVAVSDTTITANSRILLGRYTTGGTLGQLDTGTRTAGSGFFITSSSTNETSVIDYVIIEP